MRPLSVGAAVRVTPYNQAAANVRALGVGLQFIAALIVCLWFCNVPIYLGLFILPWLTEIRCVVATIAVAVTYLVMSRRYAIGVAIGLPLWIGLIAFLNLVWFVARGGGDISIVGVRLMFLSLLFAFYLLTITSSELRAGILRMLKWVAPFLVVVNLVDITHPLLFVPLESEFAHVGRAAGLFVNPNQSGAALVLCVVLCANQVGQAWRWLYIAWLCAGVGLTGSRGAMVALPMCLVGMATLGQLRWSDLRRTAYSVVAITMAAAAVLPVLAASLGVDPDLIAYRFTWLADPTISADSSSTSDRVHLAERGMERFRYSELLGNGVGSTEEWAEQTSTHNMYILLASDFGVIGFLLLPMLLLAFVGRERRELNGIVVIVFVLLWSLVSHNVLSEPYVLVALALAFGDRAAASSRPTIAPRGVGALQESSPRRPSHRG